MTAARKNWTVDLGTTFTIPFEYRFNGVPVDLTGHTIVFRMTKPGDANTTYVTKTVDGGAERTTVYFSDEETAGWVFKKAAYTLDLHEPDGEIKGLLWGSVTVRDRADV